MAVMHKFKSNITAAELKSREFKTIGVQLRVIKLTFSIIALF